MARSLWVIFGVVLVVVVSAAVMGAVVVGEEEERVAAVGAGDVGGEGHGAHGAKIGGAGTEATRVGDQGAGRGACLEEGEASGVGGGDEKTFQDLPELSSGSRPSRFRQGTIFEMFKVERGHRRQSGKGTSAPAIVEEELGSDDDDDADFNIEVEASGDDEDEEEQEAEAEEQPAQVRRGVKRRRIYEDMGIAAWSTLQGDRPLVGYRRKPTC